MNAMFSPPSPAGGVALHRASVQWISGPLRSTLSMIVSSFFGLSLASLPTAALSMLANEATSTSTIRGVSQGELSATALPR